MSKLEQRRQALLDQMFYETLNAADFNARRAVDCALAAANPNITNDNDQTVFDLLEPDEADDLREKLSKRRASHPVLLLDDDVEPEPPVQDPGPVDPVLEYFIDCAKISPRLDWDGTSLRATGWKDIDCVDFMIKLLKKEYKDDMVIKFGNYYYSGSKYNPIVNNRHEMLGYIKAQPVRIREPLLKMIVTEDTLLNKFFRPVGRTLQENWFYLTEAQRELNRLNPGFLLKQVRDSNWTTTGAALAHSGKNKEVVLKQIKHIEDPVEKRGLLKEALESGTNLNAFFSVQRGPLRTRATAGTLRKLAQMLEEMGPETPSPKP